MPVSKGEAEIWAADGERHLAAGMGYLHASGRPPRPISGTVTKLHGQKELPRPGQLYQVRWADGRRHEVECSKCAPTGCGPAIFKFRVVRTLAVAEVL